jgi:hypothetical protein
VSPIYSRRIAVAFRCCVDRRRSYRLKFRFWFEPYVAADPATKQPASHQNLVRFYWQTEAFAGTGPALTENRFSSADSAVALRSVVSVALRAAPSLRSRGSIWAAVLRMRVRGRESQWVGGQRRWAGSRFPFPKGCGWCPLAATGRAGEYDVPKGALGMPGMSVGADGTYVYTIQSSWPVQDMVTPPTLPACAHTRRSNPSL